MVGTASNLRWLSSYPSCTLRCQYENSSTAKRPTHKTAFVVVRHLKFHCFAASMKWFFLVILCWKSNMTSANGGLEITLQGMDTYPTWGKGKSSSKCHFWGICWFPGGYPLFKTCNTRCVVSQTLHTLMPVHFLHTASSDTKTHGC